MITDTKIRILSYVKTNGQARVKDLTVHLGIGAVAVHRQLKSLIESGQLIKAGTPPKVFYHLPIAPPTSSSTLPPQEAQVLDKYFAYVDPTGKLETGWGGFTLWAQNVSKTDQIPSLKNRFLLDRQNLEIFFTPDGWIDATANIAKTFPTNNALDGVYYLDFYSLPTFGKTRLGTLMLYAKQSENKYLISQLADETRPVIEKLIAKHNIHAVAFLPHSILRKVQFLKEFSARLNLSIPHISLTKAYPGNIRVAQKTLGKLEERIANAKETIFVESTSTRYQHVLLFDDAVGSGSTLNETAIKLKQLGLAQKVYGFAIVGSLKGFEVIREV